MDQQRQDQEHLERLGYKQELSRVLHPFSNFAVGFTYLSPVVGIYSLFTYGLQTGGPAFFWSIPIVVIGQLLVVLIFGELASSFPLAGALYQWARRNVGPRYGVFTGFVYGTALIVTIVAVDYGGAPFVASFFGMAADSRTNLIGISLAMLAVQTVLNIVGVRRLAVLLNLGVFAEIIGTLGIAIYLLFVPHPVGAGIVMQTADVAKGGAYLPVFLSASLFSAWIFYGFESCADVSEEVVNPTYNVPRAMIMALLVGGVTTIIATFAFLWSIPDLAAAMANPTALDYILTAALGPAMYKVFLALVIFAFLSCGGAVQVAAARVTYAFARDGQAPKMFASLHPTFHTPVNATLLTALVTAVLPFFAKAYAILTSFAVLGIYFAFQLVVLGYIVARARGWKPTGSFQLGAWGMPVAVGGLVYGVAMMVNLGRPSGPGLAGWQVALVTAAIAVAGLAVLVIYRGRIQRLGEGSGPVAAD
jgi:amino acid transporter